MTAHEVTIGSSLLPLPQFEFLSGEPVGAITSGKITVIHLWATWCGGSAESLKHVEGLRDRYPDVDFLSVAILEPDPSKVVPFLKTLGTAFGHPIAADVFAAADNRSSNDLRPWGWMAQHLFMASYQQSVPVFFIINRESKIAWIGHMDDLDQPLLDIYRNQWDIEAAANKRRVYLDQNKTRAKHVLRERIHHARSNSDYATVIEAIEEAGRGDEDLVKAEEFIFAKLDALLRFPERDMEAVNFATSAVPLGTTSGARFELGVAAILLQTPILTPPVVDLGLSLLLAARAKLEGAQDGLSDTDQARMGIHAIRGFAFKGDLAEVQRWKSSTEETINQLAIPSAQKDRLLSSLLLAEAETRNHKYSKASHTPVQSSEGDLR